MINVVIDELTPCLKDSLTGDILQTEVVRIKRKSFLRKFNKKTGWYANWDELASENEIYALVIEGTTDIQGLVALKPVEDFQAVYVSWMCTAPENNKLIVNVPKYIGVGGHLFAIATQKSNDYNYGGAITGFAANKELLKHYCQCFNAEPLCLLHQYQFFIDEANATKIRKEYTYAWTDDEL